MGTQELLDTLRRHREHIRREFRAEVAGIFGSCARGEQRDDSDLDVLVDFDEGADLFDLIHLTDYLGAVTGRDVDVLSRRALREELRAQVMRDFVSL